jgi:hypothetical protein
MFEKDSTPERGLRPSAGAPSTTREGRCWGAESKLAGQRGTAEQRDLGVTTTSSARRGNIQTSAITLRCKPAPEVCPDPWGDLGCSLCGVIASVHC